MDTGRLQQLYASVINKPMEWGVDDCILFAGDVAACYLGRDPIAKLRGKWYDKHSGLKFRWRFSYDPAAAYRRYAPLIGLKRIPVEEAVPGDLGLVKPASGEFLGAARIEQGWIVRGEKGFAVLPNAEIAWRVK